MKRSTITFFIALVVIPVFSMAQVADTSNPATQIPHGIFTIQNASSRSISYAIGGYNTQDGCYAVSGWLLLAPNSETHIPFKKTTQTVYLYWKGLSVDWSKCNSRDFPVSAKGNFQWPCIDEIGPAYPRKRFIEVQLDYQNNTSFIIK